MSLREAFLSACPSGSAERSDIRDLALKVLERCQVAILDASTFGQAPVVQDDVARRQCFAFCLYIATALRASNAHSTHEQNQYDGSLSQILLTFNVGLEDFLKELPVIIKRAEPSLTELFGTAVPLERRLKLRELQTSFVYTTVLAKKSKDLFRSYFDLAVSVQGSTDVSSPFYSAWLLFVTAKAKLLPAFPDLVASFNLLICVLNVAIVHIAPAQRTVDLNDQSLFPVRSESGSANTLQSLCLVNKANLTAVKALMHGMDNILKGISSSLKASPSHIDQKQLPQDLVTSCSHQPGFMSEPAVTAAFAEKLNAEYQQLCKGMTAVDERPFLCKAAEAPPTPGPAAPPSLSRCIVGSPQSHASPAKSRLVYLSPMAKRPSSGLMETPSPHRRGPASMFGLAQTPGIASLMSGFPGTPVSDAMTAASWLHEMALRTPQQPTPRLQRFFSQCDYDMTEQIAARIEQMAQTVLPQASPSQHALHALQSAMTNERRSQGVKLYYGVLEAMLTAEESRTQRSNFTSLLSSNYFHKCLAACAFQLVVAAYKMVTHAFPTVLEKLELHAFDLCKMIDPFVRYEPSTPRDLKRHLHSIEEKIIESLAWERGSSFYPLLVLAFDSKANANKQGPADPAEVAAVQRSSPAHSQNSPRSHPATPTKRKNSGSSLQSTPNKSHKGEKDSSPSRAEESSRPSDQSQIKPEAEGLAKLDSGVSGSSSGALGSNAASTAQQSEAPSASNPPQMGQGSTFSAFMSPMRKGAGSKAPAGYYPPPTTDLPRSCAFLQQPGPAVGDRPGRCILQEFLRKALKLAANRVHDLCSRLDLEDADPQEIETQVYALMSCVIFDHTHLLFNRHLDQIILSAIYGVCKVAQLKQVSFKQIINHYRRQPQAKSDTFRTVVLRQTEPQLQVLETGDVIAFYNRVFLPAVKANLMKINENRASLPLPPVPESLQGASPMRTYSRPEFPTNGFSTPPPANRALQGLHARNPARQVSANKQVFVSPLRQSPKQMPVMTPRTRTLYACVGESQQPFRSPSKDFDLINGRISGSNLQPGSVQGPPTQAGSAANSGSSGHSSMDASQSPSDSADLRRQSSTVSGETKDLAGSSSLLQAATERAEKWRAANQNGPAGMDHEDAAVLAREARQGDGSDGVGM